MHAGRGRDDDPGRVAVIRGQVGTVDAQGQQGLAGPYLLAGQGGLGERAPPFERLDAGACRVDDTDQLGQVGQADTGPALHGRPALDTGDRQLGSDQCHGQQIGPGQLGRGAGSADQLQLPPGAGIRRCHAGRGRGAVDLKGVGARPVRLGPGRQDRQRPQPPDALARRRHEHREGAAAHQGQHAPTGDGGAGRVGRDQAVVGRVIQPGDRRFRPRFGQPGGQLGRGSVGSATPAASART